MKDFIFGDIHGNYQAVLELLEKGDYQEGEDRVFAIGDYCDHFPNLERSTKETIDLLIKLGGTYLLGNHDIWFFNWLRNQIDIIDFELWYNQGGKFTLLSYDPSAAIKSPSVLSLVRQKIMAEHPEHFTFLENLIPYYIEDQKYVMVHAGFPTKTTRAGLIEMLTSVRDGTFPVDHELLYWDRIWLYGPPAYREAFGYVFGEDTFFITGHTAIKEVDEKGYGLSPVSPHWKKNINGPYIHPEDELWINIDSGGLSCLIVEEDKSYETLEATKGGQKG